MLSRIISLVGKNRAIKDNVRKILCLFERKAYEERVI